MSISLLSAVPDSSKVPVLIGLAGILFWSLVERGFYAVKLRQTRGTSGDRGSLWLLTISWYGAVIFSLLDAVLLRRSTIRDAYSALQFVGVPFVALGLVARVWARLTLREAFSPVVQTTESHQLVTTGIYGVIRHPAYLGTLSLLLGFPVCFGSLGGLGAALIVGIPALVYRIRVEEQALREWFGAEYDEYSETTSRLIPYMW